MARVGAGQPKAGALAVARREWVPVFARINTSAKLVALPNDTYRLFFMMLLPQCDSWGRAPADPGVLDALVWPRFKWATDVSGDALDACERAGLVEIHATPNGDRFVQVTGWEEKAGKICNQHRRGPSEWPDPSPSTRITHDSVNATQRNSTPSPIATILSSPLAVVRSPAVSASTTTQPEPDGSVVVVPEKKPRKEPTGDHAEAIAHWHAEFERTRGAPYAFAAAKDGAHVKALLASSSLAVFRQRATALLESQDAFYRAADIGTLRSVWNKLAAAKPPPRPSYDRHDEPGPVNGHKVDPTIARRSIKAAIAAIAGKPSE